MTSSNRTHGSRRAVRPCRSMPGGLALACALAFAAAACAAPNGVPEQLRMFLESETAGVSGRVEVSVGNLDSRMNLAACTNMQPFLPGGARLWGRTTLGVRCVEGATWQVFLPVQIRVYGRAPVAARPLDAGESLVEADMRIEEIELTRFPIGAIADPAQFGDKQLSRPVGVGQPLLRDQFRDRQIVSSGDMVKLVYSGRGFAVTTQARALSAATDGQSVRVVTDSGRTLSGTARPGRTVELKF